MKRMFGAAAVAVVVVTAAVLVCSNGAPDPGSPGKLTDTGRTAEPLARRDASAEAALVREDVPVPRMSFCRVGDQAAITTVVLHAITDEVRETLVPQHSGPVVAADGSGHVPLDRLVGSMSWLAMAPGYCSCVVHPPKGDLTVAMQPASQITVDVMGEDGNPVPGAWIALRPASAPASGDLSTVAFGVGDPRSRSPVWVVTTNGRGEANFNTIPAGNYRLAVMHETCYAISAEGYGDKVVDAPSRIALEMRDLWALCVIPPPGRSVQHYAWGLSTKVDRGPAVQKGAMFARRALIRRWPEALVNVTRPMESSIHEQVIVSCEAVLDGNVASSVRWPIVRIRDLTEPVVLEIDDGIVLRGVRILVFDRSGQSLDFRLRVDAILKTKEGRVTRMVRTGETALLPPGNYSLWPEAVAPWIMGEFAAAKFTVRAEDPMERDYTIRMKAALRLAVITPSAPSWAPGDVAHFQITSKEGGGSYGVLNWEPAMGAIECLLPLGPTEVRMQAARYHTLGADFDVTEGVGPIAIGIALASGASEVDTAKSELHRAR